MQELQNAVTALQSSVTAGNDSLNQQLETLRAEKCDLERQMHQELEQSQAEKDSLQSQLKDQAEQMIGGQTMARQFNLSLPSPPAVFFFRLKYFPFVHHSATVNEEERMRLQSQLSAHVEEIERLRQDGLKGDPILNPTLWVSPDVWFSSRNPSWYSFFRKISTSSQKKLQIPPPNPTLFYRYAKRRCHVP